ncbi:Mitochondrial copper homeostasis protein [Diaporthe eres]|uniref:Mitochondrial copper homeostasis protein n=1 Tax=Diaporthe eres TaxID=83184 RepID=A0ABR1NWF7_DIAER
MASPSDKGEDPWNDNTKEKFNSKSKSKWLDPCQEAASKSIKCLNRNGGDKAMCQDYFECVPHEQAGLVDWAGLGRRQQG